MHSCLLLQLGNLMWFIQSSSGDENASNSNVVQSINYFLRRGLCQPTCGIQTFVLTSDFFVLGHVQCRHLHLPADAACV